MKNKVLEGEKQFTASVWITTKSNPKKLLMLHHKKLNKWQQPGGHIERFENPIEASIRETKEETGIDVSFLLDEIKYCDDESSFLPTPRFFMEQTIASYKDQPLHYHLDLNYVVEVKEGELKNSDRESHGIGWFTKEEIENLPTHGDTKVIVNQLL